MADSFSATSRYIKRSINLNKLCALQPDAGIIYISYNITATCKADEILVDFRQLVPENMSEYSDISAFVYGLREGRVDRAAMRLVVLGNGQIGKTTLVNYLHHLNKPQLQVLHHSHAPSFHFPKFFANISPQKMQQVFTRDPSKYQPLSTVGIDQSTIQLKSGTITIWDFAGQIEYTVTHQYFLSSEVYKRKEREKYEGRNLNADFTDIKYVVDRLPIVLRSEQGSSREIQSNCVLAQLSSLPPLPSTFRFQGGYAALQKEMEDNTGGGQSRS